MTSNQRRPGFRLPWASESEAAEAEAAATEAAVAAKGATNAPAEPVAEGETVSSGRKAARDATTAEAEPEPAPPAEAQPAPADPASTRPTESATGFMRDLVEAMRRVAEETRQSGMSDLRTKAEEQVRTLEADAERRREELKARADTDVAEVGEWAQAETERIRQEAEQRVVARHAQLDQQLAADTTRSEAEAKALRDRVEEYERELDAYHARLSDIADPAAFAAVAKGMPAPPRLGGATEAPSVTTEATSATTGPSSATTEPSNPDANGTAAAAEVHPAEEEVLVARLAELDAALEPSAADAPADAPTAATAASAEPTSTEILVKGLGSFGAITGFRQALAGVEGIEGVSLSLGPTGEFVFRAIHPTGFDITAAIAKLEGDAAKIEPHADGGLRVTLDRAR